MSSQSLNDRITAARLSIAGQGLAKSVCKATTEEVIGPKKKHLDYLLHCTNEPNVSIPQMANCLIERTNNTSWVVVFKALITVHHLMCYGNERFTQYLASSNCSIQLSSFLDKAGVQGYDMSTFIRRYAKYLNEKALSYRTVAFDFCKVKRGKEDGILRTMNAEKLLKTLPILQNQLDALLEFDCTANELTNGVINTAFMLLFRDLIRLFACYNDGIINLLEKYFDMNKKMCRDALDIYKKFLIRMDRVAEALKVAANVGIDKGDIPDLTKAPSSLLDALEQHLAALEGKKGAQSGGATTPTQSTAGRQSSVKNGVLALSHTSSAFGTAAAASAGPRQSGVNGTGLEEDSLKKLALEEEEAILELHKERRIKELQTQSQFQGKDISSSTANTNPFLSSPGASASNNFIGSPPHTSELGGITSAKASDDLLCLTNNPFSDTMTDSVQSSSANLGMFWNDQNGLVSPSTSGNAFVSDASFSAIFGNSPASSAVGKSKPDSATATEGVSGSEKGVSCDLTIPGLNPFATISSTTPSPSIPFEFGGPGTTPILGTLEPQGFFDDFGGASSLGVDGNDPSAAGRKSVAEPVPSAGLGFDGQSATSGDILSICGSSLLSRPVSPSAGVHAPKSTPVSSPAPQSLLGDVDAFGEFPFRKQSGSDYSAQASTYDLGASSVQQAFVPFAESASTASLTLGQESVVSSKPTPPTALDDLNAVIKAALTNAPTSSNISSGSSLSSKGPADDASAYDMLNVNAKKSIGFGSPSKISSDFDAFGEILQPVSSTTAASSSGSSRVLGQSKVITGDLDSSLASLAQNLSINRSVAPLQKSGNLWNSPKSSAKTGGANWTPQIASSTSQSWSSPQHKYQSLSSTSGRPADWSGGMMAGHFPQGGQSAPANTGLIMGSGAPLSQPPLGVQTAKGFTVPGTFMTPVSAGQQFQPSPQKQQNAPLDPFGAL